MTKGDQTRDRILDEAMRLASRMGLEGLTIGTLAEALSLSKSGLFRHFGSKEALQVAVLDHVSQRFRERLAPRLSAERPGLARLEAMVEAWLDWIQDPDLPGGCPVLGSLFELEDRPGPPREKLLELQRSSQAGMAKLLGEAVACGDLAGTTPIAQVLFELRGITLAFHVASRLLGDPEARPRAQAAFEALMARHAASAG